MSPLSRLARSLQDETRRWGQIERDLGPSREPTMSEISVNYEPGVIHGGSQEPYQATFRLEVPEPVRGHGARRVYTVTIVESSVDGR